MPGRKPYKDEYNSDDDENVFTGSDDGEYHDQEQFHDEGIPPTGAGDPYHDPLPEEAPRREFKYSTADLNEDGKCKKYCIILMTMLFMVAIMVALSMLMQHFFFSDTSDNQPYTPERDPNGTFPLDKQDIDQSCSSGTLKADEGRRCEEACKPQFFECCDPFDEFDLYNASKSEQDDTSTFGQDSEGEVDYSQCTLDTDIRGCMAYAKCQALGDVIDPAPATLPVLCSQHHLDLDPVSCQELCKPVRCCYSSGTDNCMADDFGTCMDYAPCQNLREGYVLPTASDDLDINCLWQQPECKEECEKAKCCGDPKSTCLQDNFMSCLTYAPCNDVTTTKITLAPQFGVLEKPTSELVAACGEYHELKSAVKADALPANHKCSELCSAVLCCWSTDLAENCFFEDPLGCLAWEQQCQVLFQ